MNRCNMGVEAKHYEGKESDIAQALQGVNGHHYRRLGSNRMLLACMGQLQSIEGVTALQLDQGVLHCRKRGGRPLGC